MKLIGIMPVRNEQWCLGLTARVALMWCDRIVILLHACTDESANIIQTIRAEHPDRVVVRTHRHESWTEMAHRQQMLEIARGTDATHIAIIDADELLTANLLGLIRGHVEQLPPGVMLMLPGYNLRGG